jgi:plastocyanin
MYLKRLAVVLGAVAVASCSSNPSGPSGGHTTALTVNNNFFDPTPDTVAAGQVTFTWTSGGVSHNVTWDTGPGTLPASSSTMTSGTYQPTLVVGTYHYHCTIHGAGMSGTIVVQ